MREKPASPGYAAFKLEAMPAVLDLPAGTIRSTLLPHGSINTLGLVFEERSSGKKFAYYNDCKRVPSEAVAMAKGADAVVVGWVAAVDEELAPPLPPLASTAY